MADVGKSQCASGRHIQLYSDPVIDIEGIQDTLHLSPRLQSSKPETWNMLSLTGDKIADPNPKPQYSNMFSNTVKCLSKPNIEITTTTKPPSPYHQKKKNSPVTPSLLHPSIDPLPSLPSLKAKKLPTHLDPHKSHSPLSSPVATTHTCNIYRAKSNPIQSNPKTSQ